MALYVLGLIVCMVHSMCVRVFVHVGHAKVIVSARAPLSYDVWLRHKAWAEYHYIRYRRRGLTLSVYI